MDRGKEIWREERKDGERKGKMDRGKERWIEERKDG